jgi:DMSO/TMAO reductase YedYZ heme-binding membrane subunit
VAWRPATGALAGGAATANLLVIGLTLASAGADPPGLAAAARNTARLSALVLALAVIAGAPGWPRWHRHRVALTCAFVAAHMVHFGSVLALAIGDPTHGLHRLETPMLVITVVGFVHVLLIAVTDGAPAERRGRRWTHALLFYSAVAIVALALGSGAAGSAASAATLVVVGGAVVLRVAGARAIRAPGGASERSG